MSKKKMTPAQKASARWSDVNTETSGDGARPSTDAGDAKPEASSKTSLLLPIILIVAVMIVGSVFQGGSLF